MKDSPKWLQKFVDFIFDYRYAICLIIVICIFMLGIYLYHCRHWTFKDVSQVCTGFFIVLTLFFTALNYEFTTHKTRNDIKAARETLTYNIAAEWHKSPLKDYQKTSIEFENKFINSNTVRTANDFLKFINEPANIDFKESLKGLLNYFEAVAIAAYKGLIDKEFVREHNSIFKIYYVDYFFFITIQRISKNNDQIWINATKLAIDWNSDIIESMEKGELKSTIVT